MTQDEYDRASAFAAHYELPWHAEGLSAEREAWTACWDACRAVQGSVSNATLKRGNPVSNGETTSFAHPTEGVPATQAASVRPCLHCADRNDGVYGSYAPPCSVHDDNGNLRSTPAAPAAPAADALDAARYRWLRERVCESDTPFGVFAINWNGDGYGDDIHSCELDAAIDSQRVAAQKKK